MPLVAIQSVRFPNAFLRMDGSDVTQSEGAGSGTVNCQFYDQDSTPILNPGNLEVFELVPLGELSTGQGYAIRSFSNPNAFLRIYGSDVTQFEGAGSGRVNCQYYSPGSTPQNNSSDYEHFIEGLAVLATSSHSDYYSIMSGLFPGVFLRIDGSNVTQFEGAGSGTVNCQYYPPGSWPSSTDDFEVFNIISL
jgi:uncharacterized protein YodC (DUF2158 family)